VPGRQSKLPVRRRRGEIFDLDPNRRRTGAVTAAPALRDQPFQSHIAGGLEEVGPDLALLKRS